MPGIRYIIVFIGFLCIFSVSSYAENTKSFTILHTNDLHSHLRSEKNALNLGGVARIKTLVDSIRKQTPNSYFVDGGDFSEGHIYYNLGAGTETIKMMDHLGYDAAVIGNHDWLNGPDHLLNAIENANSSISFLATNMGVENYKRKNDFKKWVHPYLIKEKDGIKVAFLGAITYELIYDRFFKPIEVLNPFEPLSTTAKKLKQKGLADIVIAVSHNSLDVNKIILEQAPEIDLMISGHQHRKMTEPVVVKRDRSDAWIVEAGSWGRYLGRVDLDVTKENGQSKVNLKNFKLYQIDKTIKEDPQTVAMVEALDQKIEQEFGPILNDHVAHSHIETQGSGSESIMGNLTTDAYKWWAFTDLALENENFLYSNLYKGSLSTADIYNSMPGVYNPDTKKAWTLKTLDMKGYTLKLVFSVLLSSKTLSQKGIVSASGMRLVYNPLFIAKQAYDEIFNQNPYPAFDLTSPTILDFNQERQKQLLDQLTGIIEKFTIDSTPVTWLGTYKVALNESMLMAIEFINSIIPNLVPLDSLEDTQEEAWLILKEYIADLGELNQDSVSMGNRILSFQPDLSVEFNEIHWTPSHKTKKGVLANIKVKIKNYGETDSFLDQRTIHLYSNKHQTDTTRSGEYYAIAEEKLLPVVPAGESIEITWENVVIPGQLDLYPVRISLNGLSSEINHTNDSAEQWFSFIEE